MSEHGPPRYNDSAPSEKEEKRGLGSYLVRAQALAIFLVVALAITELVLTIKGRGLAHSASAISQGANGVADNANDTAHQALQYTAEYNLAAGEIRDLGANVTTLQAGLSDVEDRIRRLEQGSASASASASYSRAYDSGASSSQSRAFDLPLVIMTCIVALLA